MIREILETNEEIEKAIANYRRNGYGAMAQALIYVAHQLFDLPRETKIIIRQNTLRIQKPFDMQMGSQPVAIKPVAPSLFIAIGEENLEELLEVGMDNVRCINNGWFNTHEVLLAVSELSRG